VNVESGVGAALRLTVDPAGRFAVQVLPPLMPPLPDTVPDPSPDFFTVTVRLRVNSEVLDAGALLLDLPLSVVVPDSVDLSLSPSAESAATVARYDRASLVQVSER
jgi:hypothetical protein